MSVQTHPIDVISSMTAVTGPTSRTVVSTSPLLVLPKHIYPSDAMHKRSICYWKVSVCLSVHPSRSGIASKHVGEFISIVRDCTGRKLRTADWRETSRKLRGGLEVGEVRGCGEEEGKDRKWATARGGEDKDGGERTRWGKTEVRWEDMGLKRRAGRSEVTAVINMVPTVSVSLWYTVPNAVARLIDWAVFTSPPTQYRLYGRRFYRSKDPTNSIKVLEEQIVHRQIKHTISRHEHKTQQVP